MIKSLLLAAAAAVSFAAPAQAERVVVTADRMLDVLTGRYVERPAIFIGDDGRITSIVDAATVQIPQGTRHIDLAGRTLVPGLIDAAEALGRTRDVGAIAAGRFGDMVAVTGDPVRDVTVLERPEAMIKGGRLIPRN